MERILSVPDIFPQKYSDIIQKYIKRLNTILSEYDAVIFMARKAICFYDSLIMQKEISKTPNCCIMSSRVLEYNVLKRFIGKKVALIDDVVVKGTSITTAMDNLEETGIEPDIFIAACDINFISNNSEIKKYIREPYIILNETDICEFATYITKYIEAVGCPYNIDQPIYRIKFETQDKCDHFLNLNKNVEITSTTQKEFGVASRVIHFESSFLEGILPGEIDLKKVFIKIREIYTVNSKKIILLPFILLPPISYKTLEHVFNIISTAELEDIVYNKNQKSRYENMLNVFQYVFSNIIILKFLEEQNILFDYKKVKRNEVAQFSKCLFTEEQLLKKTEECLQKKKIYNAESDSFLNLFQFNNYISKVYDLILGKDLEGKYINSSDQEIKRNVISIDDLEKFLKQKCGVIDPHAVSILVDIFIDRGIFVPSVVHIKDTESIIRVYKGGEVAKLTQLEMNLFTYMLGIYMESTQRDYLDKTEYEKLCVLFFRSGMARGIFPNISGTYMQKEGDCYEISYAKFGPRVSLAEGKKYEAGSKVLLADEMKELELLGLCRKVNERGEFTEKYYVRDNVKHFEDSDWQPFAQVVALDFFFLRRTFLDTLKKKTEEAKYVSYYIPTYNKFLTIMSIGRNEKERLLSLVAEIYLFLSVNIEGRNLSIRNMLLKIKQKYDGICSGIWKYACYRQKNLLEKTFQLLSQDNVNALRCCLDYVSKPVDRNPNILNYLNECGDFLVNLAYALFKMGEKYSIKFNENKYDFNYIYGIDPTIIDNIDNYYKKPISEKEMLRDILQLRMEATALVDKCDIFLEEEAMFYKNYKSIFVVYSGEEELPQSIRKFAILNDRKNNQGYKFAKIPCRIGEEIGTQLESIISALSTLNTVKIILCDMQKDYEGIFCSRSSCKGRNFDKFISDLLDRESNRPIISPEFILCYKDNPLIVNMEEYYLAVSDQDTTINGYNLKRFYIHKNSNRNFIYCHKEEGFKVEIQTANNCRIIEAENYYENSNNPEVNFSKEQLEKVIDELEALKKKVSDNQVTIIQTTVEGIKRNDKSRIIEGLKSIAKLSKDVFVSVASDALVAYMKVNGILPPL